MAEREQVEEANGMDEVLELQILRDFGLDWEEVADNVGVSEHDSFGLGGGAGGENDFERIGRLNRNGTEALGWMPGDRGGQILRIEGQDARNFCEKGRPLARTQHQPGSHLRGDAKGKIWAGGIIDGDGNDAAERATEERRDPLGRVRAP